MWSYLIRKCCKVWWRIQFLGFCGVSKGIMQLKVELGEKLSNCRKGNVFKLIAMSLMEVKISMNCQIIFIILGFEHSELALANHLLISCCYLASLLMPKEIEIDFCGIYCIVVLNCVLNKKSLLSSLLVFLCDEIFLNIIADKS